jgi:hypothetical protein
MTTKISTTMIAATAKQIEHMYLFINEVSSKKVLSVGK